VVGWSREGALSSMARDNDGRRCRCMHAVRLVLLWMAGLPAGLMVSHHCIETSSSSSSNGGVSVIISLALLSHTKSTIILPLFCECALSYYFYEGRLFCFCVFCVF